MTMKLLEFRNLIASICELHPNAEIDFIYPKRHGGKITSERADMESYKVLMLGSSKKIILRLCIGRARDLDFIEGKTS